MIFILSLVLLVFTLGLAAFFPARSALVYTGLGITAAGIVATVVAFAVTPASPSTQTFALRPLTAAGSDSTAYLSTAAGSTSYAYDDNGALRTGSTTAKQDVEVRQDGGEEPRVEIIRRENRNDVFYPAPISTVSVVFHIPASPSPADPAKG